MQQISSYKGWNRRRMIKLKWEKDVDELPFLKRIIAILFKRLVPYRLCIRTHLDYGAGTVIYGKAVQKIGTPIPMDNKSEDYVTQRSLLPDSKPLLTAPAEGAEDAEP